MVAIPILKANLMLIYGFREGAFLLKKMTISVDEGTLECLRAFREIYGIAYSAVIRRAVWAYFQDKFSVPPAKKYRPSVGSSAAAVDYYAI